MPGLDSGTLNRRARFERPVADTAIDGAGSGTWVAVATVAASVQDALPSRAEKLAGGINLAAKPSRIRVRYREGLTSDMRISIGRNVRDEGGNLVWVTDRITQIVSGPAEIGDRDGLEFMVEEYSTAGGGA